jgi:hypothetical protein
VFGWVYWEKERAGEIMGHDWFRLRQLSKKKECCWVVFGSLTAKRRDEKVVVRELKCLGFWE